MFRNVVNLAWLAALGAQVAYSISSDDKWPVVILWSVLLAFSFFVYLVEFWLST
jgi:type IV secretory pathway TrbL component